MPDTPTNPPAASVTNQPHAFACSDAEAANRPVYRLANDPLPFSPNPRLAAIDVMILTYAALRHAQWLARLTGPYPPALAHRIRRDLERVSYFTPSTA